MLIQTPKLRVDSDEDRLATVKGNLFLVLADQNPLVWSRILERAERGKAQKAGYKVCSKLPLSADR